jgi:hypothetical protein
VDSILVHWPFACAKTEENKVKLGPDDKVRLFELSCLEFDKCCIVYHQEIPQRTSSQPGEQWKNFTNQVKLDQ